MENVPCFSCCTIIHLGLVIKVTFRFTDKTCMNLKIFGFCSYIILKNFSTMKVIMNITVRNIKLT